jgi:hypothetical protein
VGRIIRREFLGNRFYFLALCLTGVGIPIAIIYLLECTVTVDEEVDNPSEFLEKWKGPTTKDVFSRLLRGS